MKINASGLFLIMSLLAVGSLSYANAQEDKIVNDDDIKITHFEEFNYPTFAHAARIEGVVVVRVILNDRGDVVKAMAISGKEPLIRACIPSVMKWKFQPNARKMAVIVFNFTMPIGACDSSLFMLQGANFVTIIACPPPVEP
jgi:TonB family protein